MHKKFDKKGLKMSKR